VIMLRGLVAAASVLVLAGCASLLPSGPFSPAVLQDWHHDKAALGHTFAGSPQWHSYMTFVEGRLAQADVIDVQKHPAPYRRWWAPDSPTSDERSLYIGSNAIPVSAYWAYSGATGAEGVTAPLLRYRKGMSPEELAGRIVVFQVEPAPTSMGAMFTVGREWATEDFAQVSASLSDDQWYQGNYVTRFGRFDAVLRDSDAVGAIVVFAMGPERLDGLYTFPLLDTRMVGVPGVYVDEQAGAAVLAAADGEMAATLTLLANEKEAEPYFYTAVLPGRDYGNDDDREILLVTHSDGPNLTQENGALGIVALIQHFAQRPQEERRVTLRILLDPQHYSPGRHTIDWYEEHVAIMQRVVGIVGVEHIGQREYGEGSDGYGLTGNAEPWLIFVRDDPLLINTAIAAVSAAELPRTEIRVPERKGQGRWTGLAEVAITRDIAGFGTLSGMSGYWGTAAGIESFDAELASRQLNVLADLIGVWMQ